MVQEKTVYHGKNYKRECLMKKNYYFILNDDRTDKRDSRMYGPIPQEYIIGKVW